MVHHMLPSTQVNDDRYFLARNRKWRQTFFTSFPYFLLKFGNFFHKKSFLFKPQYNVR